MINCQYNCRNVLSLWYASGDIKLTKIFTCNLQSRLHRKDRSMIMSVSCKIEISLCPNLCEYSYVNRQPLREVWDTLKETQEFSFKSTQEQSTVSLLRLREPSIPREILQNSTLLKKKRIWGSVFSSFLLMYTSIFPYLTSIFYRFLSDSLSLLYHNSYFANVHL